jgi:lauroyl/myristoyl acyltransferase
VHIPTVIHPEELVGADPDAIVGRLNREFETRILEMPDQYFWLHDRYRDAGPAALEEAGDPTENAVSEG